MGIFPRAVYKSPEKAYNRDNCREEEKYPPHRATESRGLGWKPRGAGGGEMPFGAGGGKSPPGESRYPLKRDKSEVGPRVSIAFADVLRVCGGVFIFLRKGMLPCSAP